MLETPNVSANASDLVRVAVTDFGYVGSAAVALAVSPAQQVSVRVTSERTSVAPNAALDLVATATDASGHPVAGVLLTVIATPAAQLTPNFGLTDSGGSLRLVLTAPAQPATVQVLATVASPGSWGHGGLAVHVGNVAVPWYVANAGTIEGVGFLVALGAVLGLLVRRRRRGRRAIPEMPLREVIRENQARAALRGKAPSAPPSDPTSRTLP